MEKLLFCKLEFLKLVGNLGYASYEKIQNVSSISPE